MNKVMRDKQLDECDILTRYLVGCTATSQLRTSYQRALQNIPVIFNERQCLLWKACMKNPWLLPHVDAWLGFSHHDHPIRKKIFIMLGVLETQPDYSYFFLPSRGSFFQAVAIICRGMWAVIKIVTGRLVTWIV
jgi:hypothetical protein